jgi:DNA-binding CsgD family transcriptional regulator/tetratricopeptide (TPR) repeat protein
VQHVAGGDGIPHLVGLLAGLVDKSLVAVSGNGAPSRYRLLETIRQYAGRKLATSGEEAAVHAAHTRFYLDLAARAFEGLEGPDQAWWLERLELDHDNLREVLRRTVPGQPEDGARLAALLWPFWYRRGYYHEARSWLERAVPAALGELVPAQVLAAALTGAGVLAFLQCDYVPAAERLSKAQSLYEEEGDQVGLATTLQRLGSVAREEGRYDDARRLHEESLAIWNALGDAAGVAASQDYLGFAAWLAGDAARAVELCGRAVASFRAAGRRQETAAAMINLGVATHLSGDDDRAAALLQTGLDSAMRLGYAEGVAWALHELAVIIAADDPDAAADMLGESLTAHTSLGDRWRIASVVETIAELVAAPANPVLAATLLGAAGALRATLGAPIPPAERPAYNQCVARLRGSLDAARFGGAWQCGELMTLEELVDAALQAASTPPAGTPQAGGSREGGTDRDLGLTDREVAVLRLLSEGLTNRQIGAELHISAGTAGVHVSNILRKLGVSSRVQAAGRAHQLGLSS